jgi:DNA-directed RNA polymerase specialized sigma subunit
MTSPVDDFLEAKEAEKRDRKQNELDLLAHWKENGQRPKDLQPLLKLYEPVFRKKMDWKPPNVPPAAFKAELQIHAIKAFQSFDPTRGAALNTHVENRLHKAKRFGNRGANLLYIPEGQAAFIGKINKAREKLQEELDHEPSVQEIAHQVGLKPARVKTIMESQHFTVPMGRSAGEENYDYGSGTEATGHDFEDAQIAIAHQILPTLFPNKDHQDVFKHIYSLDGYKQISGTGELAKQMGKSPSQVARMKTHVGNVLKAHMGFTDESDD